MRMVNNRRGASLVVILALLAVCSVILLQLLTAGLQQRFQLRRDLQREQTQWLLRAGLEHAAVKQKKTIGETSHTVNVALPQFDTAKLIYRLKSDNSNPETMRVSAQIGDHGSPHQMTVLSSNYKIQTKQREPSQE